MKAYGGLNVQIHSFFITALAGGEWLASRPGCYMYRTKTSSILFCNARYLLNVEFQAKLMPSRLALHSGNNRDIERQCKKLQPTSICSVKGC
jgi:hypothetical protein